jgi:hypothetical protein
MPETQANTGMAPRAHALHSEARSSHIGRRFSDGDHIPVIVKKVGGEIAPISRLQFARADGTEGAHAVDSKT